MVTPALSVLVLTEDSGKDAHGTVKAILKQVFKFLEPDCQTQRILFEEAEPGIQRFMHGNAWKGVLSQGKSHRWGDNRRLANFHQALGGYLCTDPRSVVIVHIDGDRPWSKRKTSENLQKFHSLIKEPIDALLQLHAPGSTPDALILLCPFYSIEAWLYQNLTELPAIAATLSAPNRDRLLALIQEWEEDPTRIEQIENPKVVCPLKAEHNLRLAIKSWPAAQIYERNQSFAESVERMRASKTLLEGLTATTHYESPGL